MTSKAKAPTPASSYDEGEYKPHFHGSDFEHMIERDVPIPATRGATAPYPFDKMEVGESLFIRRPDRVVNISNVKQSAEKKLPGTKWTTRKVDGGFRIWRVK